MKEQPDILLGQIAVEAGFITPVQLAECVREQESNGHLPIGALLLKRGYLQQGQLEKILAEQQKRLNGLLDTSDPRIEDALLGRLLIRQGLATEKQVYECMRLQAEMAENGDPPLRLGELLVHRNYIASDSMETALLLKKQEVFVCPSCGAHYSTLGADPGRKYPCRKCGGGLTREERLFRPGETTGAVRIDMPDDAAAAAQDPGRRFAGGRYVLIQEVGRGGMGVVWKAWQSDLRRYVAIKLLAGVGWTEQDLRRFHREAQTAASLSHSNIASIYEVGVDDHRHYISMEFVDGETLSNLVVPPAHGKSRDTQRRHVGLKNVVEIVRDIALAVDYAHSKGIVHRDLKPGNIMITKQGRSYVMDFGLARPVNQESISADSIMGTPQYMSPEQARGDTIDRRADVYSLGAVLYAALTGRSPFAGKSPAETLMKVISEDVVPPRKLNPRVHADLETICLKALDKDRHRRYDSARTFADDLSRYLEGEPISARPLSWRERLWKEARRRPVATVLVAGVTAASLIFIFTLLVIGWRHDSRVQQFVEEGDGHFAREQYEAARSAYDKALALEPGQEVAMYRKRLCDQAIESRRTGAKTQVRSARELADMLYDAGAWEKALLQYRKILGMTPADEWALDRKRLCESRIAKAKEEAKLRDEADAQARALEEKERQRAERRERAMPYYESARATLDVAARLRAIPTLVQKYREAADALTRAIREDDAYVEAWFLRGIVRSRMADYALAEQDFAMVQRLSPSFAAAGYQSAVLNAVRVQLHSRAPYVKNAEEVKGALSRQLKAAEQVLALTAPAFERWCAKALQLLHARKFEEALEALDRVRIEGGGQYAMLLLRAIIHVEAGNDAQALPVLISAIEMEPAAYESLYLRALLRDRADDLDGALEDANKVVEIAPDNFLSYLLRAHIHHRKTDLRRSISDLEKAATCSGAPAEQILEIVANLRNPDNP